MSPAPTGLPRSGEEIQVALQGFVSRWQSHAGTERSEAQTFLNELFECFGTSRIDVGAKFEDFQASASGSGFMDLQRLHRALDEAVADCYGWPNSVAQDDAELVRRLTALNRQIVEGEVSYLPFAYLDSPTPVEANAGK